MEWNRLGIGDMAFGRAFIHGARTIRLKCINIVFLARRYAGIPDIGRAIMVQVDARGIILPGRLCDQFDRRGWSAGTAAIAAAFITGGPGKEDEQKGERKGYDHGYLFHRWMIFI